MQTDCAKFCTNILRNANIVQYILYDIYLPYASYSLAAPYLRKAYYDVNNLRKVDWYLRNTDSISAVTLYRCSRSTLNIVTLKGLDFLTAHGCLE